MKNLEIPKWLERLPLAPEFRPTDTEFVDPIAYISKIEKEASAFGICKVIPPLPKPSKKYVLQNLNKSLSKCPELGSDVNLVTSPKTDSGGRHNCDRTVNNVGNRAVFTTRHQELGCEKGKRVKGAVGGPVVGARKQVWQSGEVYTIEQFETKSKNFAKSHLGTVKDVNPLVVEDMFWKATLEKPIYVEYANDVPGSGFAEPEGILRYFDRRRRKRRKRNSFDRNFVENPDRMKNRVDGVSSVRSNEDSCSQNNPNFCTEASSNSNPSFSGRNDFHGGEEMDGTAGWKLSNSPWNLQLIARSHGSLTRFMPDDIPGVTSPMVYIGMLFSWFAWHVEDHELHSLNFLHMGSPKTWYAVPGDCAVNFEEAVRLQAYGGNADRLVALSLLGEKTTVLSPEIIVSSGIPCCRLVQNPGEFVVTFPRAYHIGFSHGFNCGEAANFGTPKWLTIAKEAAVRRAAMSYLPMLSHQQLLYLLTMSFISRIPRSLLPGVRSSRLRDRQKEERELLVKRAFIEDILHENSLLTVLLQRNPSYRAVLWDVESMPSSNKESELNNDTDDGVLTSLGKDSPKNCDNTHDVNQMSDYICAVGFDLNDDNLPYDFQLESGSLPCVACGILGFPFMAVLQPSNVASSKLLSDHDNVVEGSAEDSEKISLCTDKAKLDKKDLHHVNEASSAAETSLSKISAKVEIAKGWNISNVSLKPRIFCLEHAIEIEELLNSKGGANVLVICHSDFQKIKSHAADVADGIAVPFCYTEIPLGNASPEDLNLIDIAIDREKEVDRAEDWTSQLSIDLQHCVKVKKASSSKNVQHLFNFGGLFSDASISNTSGIRWISRKLRSKRQLKKLILPSKASDGSEILEDMKTKKEDSKDDDKIIQYSRKRFKARASRRILGPTGNNDLVVRDISDTDLNDPDEEDKHNTGDCAGEDKIGNSCNISEAHDVRVTDRSTHKNETCYSETVGSTLDENRIDCALENEILREEVTVNEFVVASENCGWPIENDCEMPPDEEASRRCSFSNYSDDSDPPSKSQYIQTDEEKQEKFMSSNTELINESTSDLSGEHETQLDTGCHNVFPVEKNDLDDPMAMAQSEATAKSGSKRKREVNLLSAEKSDSSGFIRSPCEGLRRRAKPNTSGSLTCNKKPVEDAPKVKILRKATDHSVHFKNKKEKQTGRYNCKIDGCTMSFPTKAELILHKGNRCPVKGCRKKFNSHKYAVQHKRVHNDERPLKCTWAGCTMSFKWAWARTEHLRLHTGERPYACKVNGCGLTFRFISDFSRHRRKTGHYAGSPA